MAGWLVGPQLADELADGLADGLAREPARHASGGMAPGEAAGLLVAGVSSRARHLFAALHVAAGAVAWGLTGWWPPLVAPLLIIGLVIGVGLGRRARASAVWGRWAPSLMALPAGLIWAVLGLDLGSASGVAVALAGPLIALPLIAGSAPAALLLVGPPGLSLLALLGWGPGLACLAGLLVVTLALFRHRLEAAAQALATRRLRQRIDSARDSFRVLAENASDLISIVDSLGEIHFQNPASQRVLGYWPGELEGSNLGDLAHPDDLPGLIDFLARAVDSPADDPERRPGLQLRIRNREGDYRRLALIGQSVPDLPYAPAAVVTAKDVTAEHQAAEYLRQARDRAEQAGQAKAEFLATMSHEIRTPMSGLLGLIDLLARTDLQPEQRRYLDLLATTGQHLFDLLNDILDFSKIEAGRLDLREAPFSLPELVSATVDLMTMRAEEKGLALSAEVDPALPPLWIGDERLVRQILVNLVGNALKFTERGGVTVHVGPAGDAPPDAPPATPRGVVFSVRDTGIGIPPEKREAIFESFAQLDTSRTRRFGGTGLGLAICRRLVELMGGWIEVDSQPGRGSTFRFQIRLEPCPERRRARRGEDSAERPSWRFAPARLLLVDDSALNRMVLRGLLAGHPFELSEAEDGRAALDRLEAEAPPFDLVIMDMQMPRLDGIEVLRRLRAREARLGLARTRVMILSATALAEDRTAALAAGCDEFAMKPLRPGALERLLGRLLPRTPEAAEGDDGESAESPAGPDLSSLLPRFVARAGAGLPALEAAIAAADWPELGRLAHGLKGDSALVGASDVTHLARALEGAAARADGGEAEAVRAGLEAALAELAENGAA
ncbi:hybrid sensor histidine kinase/response regulator [Roseospirillum parvum]|uniref:hybrid sensor histidine kinase/response regulator n=1 Tax=Roseospirillum parvum TaxID=83401 RepID=UPI000B85D1A7|nr:ATP-binding protein [Roseospirillum parvum]